MNGSKHNLASIETLPQIVATGPALLGAFSAGGKFGRPGANKLGAKAKDIIHSQIGCSRQAFPLEEMSATGFGTRQPWSGVMLPPNCLLPTEYCWRQWERIIASAAATGPDPSAILHV
jgi:hypothetical protein